jgi:DNA-binding NtrC family response regulator
MPGLPCQEVVKRLQALRPDTQILLSSGYTAGASIAPLMHRTGTGLLRKPYDPDRLLAAVRKVLDAPSPPPAQDAAPSPGSKKGGDRV